MKSRRSSFNKEQIKAIEHGKGPLLIIAGAGTGKTTVITEKIKYLIQRKKIKPEQILALTFTEKAAYEMEERVDKALPYGYFQMWISTFHGFADHILKAEGNHIGINQGFKLMGDAESVLFLRNRLFLFKLKYFRPLGNPHKFIEAMLQHFSRLQDEDISPDIYLQWAKKLPKKSREEQEERDKYIELAEAYKTFQILKLKEGYLDFSDLIYYAIQLLRTRPHILAQYRTQFPYVLVDEFQDTNIAQYELIKLLAPAKNNPNLTVVGDDSQAIYKFRGASISNILTFMKDYPKAYQVTLRINYRSRQTILDAAYKLIQHNNPDTLESKLGISKKLIAAEKKADKNDIGLYIADNETQEAQFVANQILALKSHYRFKDFAILVRANNSAVAYTRELAQQGIPYQFFGPGILFRQPEVKDLIAYLKVLYNLEDSPSLYRVLSMDLFDIEERDVVLLLSFAKKVNVSLFQAVEIFLSFTNESQQREEYTTYQPYLPLLSEKSKEKIKKIHAMIERHLKLMKRETAGQILYYFLEDSEYLPKLTKYSTTSEEKIALNISKFFKRLKTYENEHEDASVFAVVDFIEMSMELGESPFVSKEDSTDYDAVNILTVHGAKGLEFPVVFLVNLSQGKFPTREKKETIPIPSELIKEILPEGDFHIQEERRLFYVGLTRAKDTLFLSSSRFATEGKRERRISPFLTETLGVDMVQKKILVEEDKKKQLSLFEYKKKVIPEERTPNKQTTYSFSQLQTYETCPLRYKYQYVLKIPTISNAPASFGDTMHRTFQRFYTDYLKDPSIGKTELLSIYKSLWIPVGYNSKKYEERMKKEGVNILEKYFDEFHTKELSIKALEQSFKIKLDKDTSIIGKIDRVDESKNSIEIIDYKTGKKPSEADLKKSLQLSIYALAASDKGMYGKKLSDIKLSFFFLQTMEKITIQRTEADISSMKKQVAKTIDEIRTSSYPPKVGPWCDFCPFRMICEAWQ